MAPSAADAFCVASSVRAPVVVVLELLAVDGAGGGDGDGAGAGAGISSRLMSWLDRPFSMISAAFFGRNVALEVLGLPCLRPVTCR